MRAAVCTHAGPCVQGKEHRAGSAVSSKGVRSSSPWMSWPSTNRSPRWLRSGLFKIIPVAPFGAAHNRNGISSAKATSPMRVDYRRTRQSPTERSREHTLPSSQYIIHAASCPGCCCSVIAITIAPFPLSHLMSCRPRVRHVLTPPGTHHGGRAQRRRCW